jgi:hypothetical protein
MTFIDAYIKLQKVFSHHDFLSNIKLLNTALECAKVMQQYEDVNVHIESNELVDIDDSREIKHYYGKLLNVSQSTMQFTGSCNDNQFLTDYKFIQLDAIIKVEQIEQSVIDEHHSAAMSFILKQQYVCKLLA